MEKKRQWASRYCAVRSCKINSDNNEGYSFFRFPKEENRILQWIENCQRRDLLERDITKIWKSTYICGKHFEDRMFLNDLRNRLHLHAVPTLFTTTQLDSKSSLFCNASVVTHSIVVKELRENADVENVPAEISDCEPKSSVKNDTHFLLKPSKSDIGNFQKRRQMFPNVSLSIPEPLLEPQGSSSYSTTATDMVLRTSENSSRKLKLKKPRRKVLRLEPIPPPTQEFLQLCDTYLPPQLATIIRFNAEITRTNAIEYPAEYKQFALKTYFLGPRVYKYFSKMFRLPTVRTLRRWSQSWDIEEEKNLFEAVKLKTSYFKKEARGCVLCVDKMPLKCNLFYNRSKDQIIGFHKANGRSLFKPAKFAFVVFAKGIHVDWEQPLGYALTDSACVGEDLRRLLFSTISQLKTIDLHVRAVISNAGGDFIKFASDNGVTPDTPFFFVGDDKIFYLYDTPHLLNSMRDIFFKYNVHFDNFVAEKKYIETFYKRDKEILIRSAPKLTDAHINPSASEKKDVKYAAQIFSQTIAAGLSTYVGLGALPACAVGTIVFVDRIDKLFDVLNSNSKTHTKQHNQIFTGKEFQLNFLKETNVMFENMKTIDAAGANKTRLIRNFNCWRVTISAVLNLWETLGKSSLFTRRLQKDSLANFFRAIRQQCGNAKNPTPIRFKRAFKKLFCLNYFQYTEGANCAEDFDLLLNDIKNNIPTTTRDLFSSNVFDEKKDLPVDTADYTNLDLPQRNAFTYVCDYLLKKSLEKHTCSVCAQLKTGTMDEAGILCHAGQYEGDDKSLIITIDDFRGYIYALEFIFVNKFENLATRSSIGQELRKCMDKINFCPCPDFPKSYLLNLFIRMRIFYAIKYINRDFVLQKERKVKSIIVQHL